MASALTPRLRLISLSLSRARPSTPITYRMLQARSTWSKSLAPRLPCTQGLDLVFVELVLRISLGNEAPRCGNSTSSNCGAEVVQHIQLPNSNNIPTEKACREVKDVKMRTYAMDLVATQAILAFCKPTTASPFTAELVAEGGIVTLNKLLAFISSAPQVPELR